MFGRSISFLCVPIFLLGMCQPPPALCVAVERSQRPNSGRPLSTGHVTLAEVRLQNGYATGIVGEWHLSGDKCHGAGYELRPDAHGFSEEIATPVKGVGNGANLFPYVFRTQPISWL